MDKLLKVGDTARVKSSEHGQPSMLGGELVEVREVDGHICRAVPLNDHPGTVGWWWRMTDLIKVDLDLEAIEKPITRLINILREYGEG